MYGSYYQVYGVPIGLNCAQLPQSFSVDALREVAGLNNGFVEHHTSIRAEAYRHLATLQTKPDSARTQRRYATAVSVLRDSWRRAAQNHQ